MNSTAQRILTAIQGDHDSICALASAIARDDGASVRSLLGARGVVLSDDEVREVMRGATSAGAASTNTNTNT